MQLTEAEYRILKALTGKGTHTHATISAASSLSPMEVNRTINPLEGQTMQDRGLLTGYLEVWSTPTYAITQQGLAAVEAWETK